MKAFLILSWVARIGSVISLALLIAFVVGSGGFPTMTEDVALGFFPLGVAVGFIIAWRREVLGGAITVLSFVAFYLWMFVLDARLPHGPYFLLFSAPGFLFLALGLLEKRMLGISPLPAQGLPLE